MRFPRRYLLTPLILIVFTFLLFSLYEEVKNKRFEEFNDQQLLLAQQASKGIESFFIYYKRELTFLSRLPDVSDFDNEGKELLTEFFANHSDQIEAVTRVDENGNIMFTFPRADSLIGANISGQEHVKRVMETKEPTVSDVFFSVQGYLAVAYHVPVFSGGKFKGTLALLVSLDLLGQRYLSNIKVEHTGFAWLLSEKNVELFSPVESHVGLSAIVNHPGKEVSEMLGDMRDKKYGVTYYHEKIDGGVESAERRIVAVYYKIPLENTFWTIIISTPEDQVYATLSNFRNKLYSVFLLILIVFAFYFYSFAKARTVIREENKRRLAELSLAESERKYHSLFDDANDMIHIINSEGFIIDMNKSELRRLGYDKNELLGRSLISIIHPDYHNNALNNLEQVAAGNLIVNKEMALVSRTGEKINVEFSSVPEIKENKLVSTRTILRDITDRKLSEEKLQESEKKYRELMEFAPDAFLQGDSNGKIITINNKAVSLTGYSKEELLCMNIKELFSDSTLNLKPLRYDLLENFETITSERELRRKDGSSVIIEMSSKKMPNGTYQSFMRDITERKRAEEDIFKFKIGIERSDESLFLTDTEGVIQYVNPAFTKIYGYSFDEVCGKTPRILKSGILTEEIYVQMWEHLKNGEAVTGEIINRRKDGKLINIEGSNNPILDAAGRLLGYMAIHRDITLRKLNEETILKGKLLLERVQSMARVGSWEIDLNTKNVSASKEAHTIYGVPEGSLTLEAIQVIPLPEYRPLLDEALKELITEGKKYNVEFKIKRVEDGEIRVVKSIAEYNKASNTITGAIQDITDEKRLIDELKFALKKAEKSDKLKTEFLAQISHEIRSPINIMMSYTNLIKDDLKDLLNAEQSESFAMIESASRRVIRTIDLILNVSEVQSGSYEPIFRNIDIYDHVLARICDEFRRAAGMKNLSLRLTNSADATMIYVDEYSVYQIFVNLIDNAIKYTNEGGVDVSVSRNPEGRLTVEVADTGIGISKEFLPSLFTAFTQEEQGYSRRYEGNGLGMALVKNYCEINKARIEVESEKGKGTIFTVTF